jgi:hypothetical protein
MHADRARRIMRKTGTFVMQQFQVTTWVGTDSMIWLTDLIRTILKKRPCQELQSTSAKGPTHEVAALQPAAREREPRGR